jgi:hypothetical protein
MSLESVAVDSRFREAARRPQSGCSDYRAALLLTEGSVVSWIDFVPSDWRYASAGRFASTRAEHQDSTMRDVLSAAAVPSLGYLFTRRC